MCHFIFLASPLTLSEIRSMVPLGMAAELAAPPGDLSLKRQLPGAQALVRLLRGACSCDLLFPRLASSREDEARLRTRYRALGLSRIETLAALERHRLGGATPSLPAISWPHALAGFVAEHARNAGPSLYCAHFSPTANPPTLPPHAQTYRITAREVRENPDGWLTEERLVVVLP